MNPAEEERLRGVEIWQARHETQCSARHEAIARRFDVLEAVLGNRLKKQDWLRLAQTVALIAVVLMGATKQPKVLFDLIEVILRG